MPLQPSCLLATPNYQGCVLGLGGVAWSMLSEGDESLSQAKAMVTSPHAETRMRVAGRYKDLLTSDPPGIERE